MSQTLLKPTTTLRGVAALSVFFHHSTSLLTPAFGALAAGSTALFINGYLWVDFFFILSGFILTCVYSDRFKDQKISYLSFISARFARIYPAHLVVLSLFFLLETYLLLKGDNAFTGFNNQPIDLIRSLLLVNSLQMDPGFSPWNGPSWSISAEWLAYLGFPAALAILLSLSKSTSKVLLIITALAGLYLINQATPRELDVTGFLGITRCYLEAAIGIALAQLKLNGALNITSKLSIFTMPTTLALIILCMHANFNDTLIVALMAALIILATTHNRINKTVLSNRHAAYLGEISYSFYLGHFLIFVVIRYILNKFPAVDLATTTDLLEVFMITSTAMIASGLFAAVLFHFVESPSRIYLKEKFQSGK